MPPRAKVDATTINPTHLLSLSDGVQNYGLAFDNGWHSLQESPQTPSTLMINSQGGKYGNWDPSQSHIQQDDFRGGRGSENFNDDNTRYFDARNCWTLNDAGIFPSLQWKHAKGLRAQDIVQLQNNYQWYSLAGQGYSTQFTASQSYNADRVYIWLKRVGRPGTLTMRLRNAGDANGPGTVLKTVTAGPSIFEENVIYNYSFNWPSVQALTSGTKYHIEVYGAVTDTPASHWEIMTYYIPGETLTSFTTQDETTWGASDYHLYFRVTDADVSRQLRYFQYNSNFYVVTIPASGNSKLYVVSDVTASETTNTGKDKVFTEVTSTGLTLVSDVLVCNGIVYFAQGESTNIRRWNGTTWADDGTNKATLLYNYTDASKPVIWRANVTACTISKAETKAWGTDLTFGTAIKVGESTNAITNITGYNDALWIMKKDSVWALRDNKPSKLDIGIDDAINTANGVAATAHGLFLYFSFVTSLEQLYGSTLSDVGPGHGAGLPDDRTGGISDLNSVMSHLLVAVDGYALKYSSVLLYDGINYHEIWRGPEKGRRIRSIYWQSGEVGANPYLWIDYGGDPVYIKFPAFGFNCLRDTSLYYAPDAHIITSTFDMGAARLPKIFKELTIISKNLAVSRSKAGRLPKNTLITRSSHLGIDYQLDDDIGSTAWNNIQPLGNAWVSPQSIVPINEDQCYAIRFRIRFQVSDAANPPIIKALVLEGAARTPIKYQWVIRAKVSSNKSTLTGVPDADPDEILKWLKEKATRMEKVTMHSTLKALDNRSVMVEPPSVIRDFSDPQQHTWGGTITLVLRET